jgi:cytochrome c peroxidase
MALTPDGRSLAVASTRARTVAVLDAATGTERHAVKTLGRNLRHVAVSPDGEWAYLPGIAERGAGVSIQNIDRGWIVGNRLLRVPLKEDGPREAITLDMPRDGVADVDGCALSPDGKTLALTAAGTHELIFLPTEGLPFVAYGGPGDFRDDALQDDPKRFRRVKLGGRPLGAAFAPDGKRVVVANYLADALQIVDVATGAVTTVPLGGPKTPDPARQGEAIFYDAGRSFGSWYSCGSCHTEGHTNGGNFDTLNDGGVGKPKKTLSLRGLARTAPYTWHGWNQTLDGAIRESMIKTMQAPPPTDADVAALVAFVRTLDFRPNPNRPASGPGAEAIRRGEAVFNAKGCATCHAAPDYTKPEVYTVGLESPDDVYPGYNPPSLRGIYARAPYLHDGRAKTLEDVLTRHHRPSKLTGVPDCTPAELADLVAFLRSL